MIQIGAQPATIETPIEHLMACHRRIEQRLDTLVNAADHLLLDRGMAIVAIEKSFRFLDTNGALHTEDEEVSLFPRLRLHLTHGELEFVNSLEQQHREADQIYAELKAVAANISAEAAPRFRERAERLRTLYREHIRKEDEILTRIARRTLTTSEMGEIVQEMRARREA
jgi:hemerythrin-like domain-containing protein